MNQINKIEDFFSFLKQFIFQTREIIFRGHSRSEYKLISGLGRTRQADDRLFTVKEEKKMIYSYIKQAHPLLEKGLVNLECMAIAQHHGLPTRLLDWTWNPLVAFYFAIENDDDFEKDGALFYLKGKGIRSVNPLDRIDKISQVDPFKIRSKIVLYEPKFVSPRIIAQSGLCSIHPSPNKKVIDRRIHKVIVSKKVKGEIGKALETMGIHAANLFPGLDGTSKHIKWLYSF